MQVTVDLTRADLLQMSLYSLFRLRANQVAFLLVWMMLFVLSFLYAEWPPSAQELLRRVAVATLGATAALGIGFCISVLTLLANRRRTGGLLGACDFTITEEGLLARGAAMHSLSKWVSIQSIVKTPRWIVIHLHQRGFQMVPRRAFATRADHDAFFDRLTELWSKASDERGDGASAERMSTADAASEATGVGGASRSAIGPSITNLILGARLAVGLPVHADAFRPSLEGAFVLLLVALAVGGVASYLTSEGEVYFDAFGAAMAGCLLSFFLLYVLGVARAHGAAAGTLIATLLAASLPWYVGVAYATAQRGGYAVLLLELWGAFILIRALRLALPGRSGPAIAVTILLVLGAVLIPWYQMPAPNLFYGYDESEAAAYDVDAEEVYYRQPSLVASATSALLPQTAGVPDLYFVGFAGDGESAVFEREAEYARSVLDDHYGTAGRSIVLSNDLSHLDDAPLANRHNLALALEDVAARMDPDEDALFLFLTSHGSEGGELTVTLEPFELVNLTADDVRAALDEARIRWRMIVISACHSGSFIDTLRDDRTVILTAAAADRQSFGCADDRELTYFGEAFFRDALSDGADLLTAFAKARGIIATRETAEELTPSLPQIDVGPRMKERLESLQGQRGRLW